ncbi:B-cell CLL/lymphoma 7 protein family member A-like [Olea europaea var. sylvestris]|uniref:B-cell CLL/lymphoma 7 protein family member A-like n=1 Tax=Olea europaea var. sylvestris TaxID=158386 RepID=UPI000C1D38BF|nr:B-cell CLL/lymphoma 7 protein family member A-like [Olea europaea var. sylvestris]
MEGVGARFGRSSSRYGPSSATVFTGPVRKWKKKWVNVPPSNSNQAATNGIVNGSSHLLLYKWTPIQKKDNNDNNINENINGNDDSKNSDIDDSVDVEKPPKRKFKYIPIALLVEQKNESSEEVDDEAKSTEADKNADDGTPNTDGCDEKPDINDVPMDENQVLENNPVERQDLNESTLDLSLG